MGSVPSTPVLRDLHRSTAPRDAFPAGTLLGGRLTAWAPEAAALLGLAAWLLCFRNGPLINDVGWQLWIGRRINEGAILYRDILEINPPLWFWFGALIQRAAVLLGVSGPGLLTTTFAAVAGLAVLLCRPLAAEPGKRAALGGALVLTLFLTSPFALGQREQFVFITALPWIALAAARAEGRRVPVGLAVAVGVTAAAGFALKHYFVLVPLALEAWLCWRRRKLEVRPELIAVATLASLYVGSILLLTPDYLRTMVPLISTAYGGFDRHPLLLIRQPPLFAALLVAGVLWFRPGKASALASAATVATGAFAAVYFIQAKGFEYHTVPVLGGALVSLFALLAKRDKPRRGGGLPMAGAALACALATPLLAGPARYDDAARAATAGLPPGSGITLLSSSGVAVWPLVQERGLVWRSPHMMLWMLAPAWSAAQEGESRPELQQLAARVRAQVASEINCTAPAMVLVDTRYDRLAGTGGVLGFFQREPDFVRAMRSYQRAPDAEYLQVWRRAAATAPPSAHCGRAGARELGAG